VRQCSGFGPNSLLQAKFDPSPDAITQIVGKVVVVVVKPVETPVGMAVGLAVGLVRRVVHGYCRAVRVGGPQRRLMDESVSGFPACRPPLFPRHGPRALFVAVLSRDVKDRWDLKKRGKSRVHLTLRRSSGPPPSRFGAFAAKKGGEGGEPCCAPGPHHRCAPPPSRPIPLYDTERPYTSSKGLGVERLRLTQHAVVTHEHRKKTQARPPALNLVIWRLELPWNLGVGPWNLDSALALAVSLR
jgi:hypothetical protein